MERRPRAGGDPVDPVTTTEAVNAGAQAAQTLAAGSFDTATLLRLLQQGALTTYPLALCSVLALAVVIERFWRYRGLDKAARDLTRRVVDALAKRDVSAARAICEGAAARQPLGEIFGEGLRWKNIALEDLDRVLATSRQEAIGELRRSLWVLGTIGSLAPFIGLFGTVVGIIKAFHEMAVQGSGGFAVVAAGISEALVATAAGLLVAIIALLFYNYLQVRVNAIANTYARACERFVQALLYVEASAGGPVEPDARTEVGRGHPLPA
jgi:biopolymer transport protein ExbB